MNNIGGQGKLILQCNINLYRVSTQPTSSVSF